LSKIEIKSITEAITMEPVSTFIATNLFGWGISKVAETIWQGAGDRIQKTIHKSDIERGIKSG